MLSPGRFGFTVCQNISERAMNISLVLFPLLLFVAFARWVIVHLLGDCDGGRGDRHENGIGCYGGGDGDVMMVVINLKS